MNLIFRFCYIQIFILVLLLTNIGTLYALGISTDFNNIFIENLQIGKEYNLTELVNLPFKAKNTSEEKVKLTIQPILPSVVKDGFEMILSTTWVKISNPEVWVEPGGFAVSDVIIKIPDDKSLLGRKFQVNIWCYISSIESSDRLLTVTPGVEGRLFFSIAKEVDNRKIKPVDINFEVEPKEFVVVLSSAEMFIGELQIKNNSKHSYVYSLSQVDPDKVNIELKPGYDKLQDNSLHFIPQKLKINRRKTGKSSIYFCAGKEIEDQKKYFGIIEVQVSGKGLIVSRYVKIFLEPR